MGRSSTTFTKGDPRAIAARLKHGARSEVTVTALAKTIERQLRRELQEAGLKRPLRVRRHAARIEAIVTLAHAAIEAHGGLMTVGKNGKLEAAGVSDVYLRASNQLTGLYRELGLMSAETDQGDDLSAALAQLRGG